MSRRVLNILTEKLEKRMETDKISNSQKKKKKKGLFGTGKHHEPTNNLFRKLSDSGSPTVQIRKVKIQCSSGDLSQLQVGMMAGRPDFHLN